MTRRAPDKIQLAFAKVGLDALIDEATGYQKIRPRGALYEQLGKYLGEKGGERDASQAQTRDADSPAAGLEADDPGGADSSSEAGGDRGDADPETSRSVR